MLQVNRIKLHMYISYLSVPAVSQIPRMILRLLLIQISLAAKAAPIV